jgi:iron(III) transport system permease protein
VILATRYLEGRKGYVAQVPLDEAPLVRLGPVARWLASLYAFGVFALGFGVPAVQLASWVLDAPQRALELNLLGHVGNSLVLAATAAFLTTLIALLVATGQRFVRSRLVHAAARLAGLGYALPGAVLAIGLFLPVTWLDHQASAWLESWLDRPVGLIFTGTLALMLLGLVVRFLAVAQSTTESGMKRLSPRLDEAAATFGVKGLATSWRIHLPLLKKALFTSGILVFVDVLKEMPLTLMTRPFGWDTLSVRIFELTSEGDWQRAAWPSLVLLLAGLVPVGLLARRRI